MQIPDSVKTFVVRSLPYLATAVVGAGVGWGIKPDQVRVEEKVRVETMEKQVVVTHETVRVEVVKVKDSQVVERWHREKTETKSPDGTVVKKETEDRNIDTIVKEKENNTQVQVVEVEKKVYVDREVTHEKIVTPVLANWHVSALVGAPVRLPLPNLSTDLVLGVEAERRVMGPFWGGLWTTGNLNGGFQGGVKLGVQF